MTEYVTICDTNPETLEALKNSAKRELIFECERGGKWQLMEYEFSERPNGQHPEWIDIVINVRKRRKR